MKTLLKNTTLFFIGGIIYYLIEIAWRGHSHWTMYLLGGFCFLCIGLINEILIWEIKFWKQALIGAVAITALEFLTGCVVNIAMFDLICWDKSVCHMQYCGFRCLPQE